VTADRLHTRCGWTPYEGFDAVFPRTVLRRGDVVYEQKEDGERFGEGGGRLLS
jgi:dihydroorotase